MGKSEKNHITVATYNIAPTGGKKFDIISGQMKKSIIRITVLAVMTALLAATALYIALAVRRSHGRAASLAAAEKAFAEGRYEKAKSDLKWLLAKDANSERAILLLADIAAREGDAPAEARYRGRAMKLDESAPGRREAYIAARAKARDWGAIGSLLQADPERSADGEALLAYADLMTGNRSEAAARWDRFKAGHPGTDGSELVRFIAARFTGAKAGIEAFAKAIEPFTAAEDGTVRLEALITYGETLAATGDHEGARRTLLEAARLGNYAATPIFARELLVSGAVKEGLDMNSLYLKQFPNPALAAEQAEWLAITGDTNRIAELKTLFRRDNYRTLVLKNYIDAMLAYIAEDNAALLATLPSTRADFRSPWARMMSVRAYILEGGDDAPARVAEECRALALAAKFFNCHGRAYAEAARYMYGEFKRGRSVEALAKLIEELAKCDRGLVWKLARQLALEDMNTEAIALYESINDFEPEVLVNLSELYAATGEKEKAMRAARSALTKSPADPNAKMCYERRLKEQGLNAESGD